MNEEKILALMEKAEKAIAKLLEGTDRYMDDLKWGKDRFQICIYEGASPMECREVDDFTFIYDEDDVWERSVNKQMWDSLKNWLERRV